MAEDIIKKTGHNAPRRLTAEDLQEKMATESYRFPSSFVWGCSTSAYQVEGAAAEDGRGPSVWDTFSRLPGRIAMDQTGEVAVDQYHRYKEDVGLMKWLGLDAYRFSVSWPRVFPEGFGRPNEKGLAYYDRLVDELLANRIEPWLTFFHWDLPQALEDRFGGWESRETAKYFAEYVACVTARLSDRVSNFFTINEFACFTDMGYSGGINPPGKVLPARGRNQVRHNALLAHGLAVRAIRASARKPPNIGLAENARICVPVIETDEHIAAARSAMRQLNGHFLTAVLEGKYPDTYLSAEGSDAPEFSADDMEIIGSRLDFVGLNAYTPVYVRADKEDPAGFAQVPYAASHPRMDVSWLYVEPEVIYWGTRLLKEVWGVDAVVISENGCPAEDRMAANGQVYDTDRLMYLRHHLIAAHRAVSEGWPLKGYFIWSLLDNFEWTYGYGKRCGIFYVNYQTLERVPKLSANFYREVILRNAVV